MRRDLAHSPWRRGGIERLEGKHSIHSGPRRRDVPHDTPALPIQRASPIAEALKTAASARPAGCFLRRIYRPIEPIVRPAIVDMMGVGSNCRSKPGSGAGRFSYARFSTERGGGESSGAGVASSATFMASL